MKLFFCSCVVIIIFGCAHRTGNNLDSNLTFAPPTMAELSSAAKDADRIRWYTKFTTAQAEQGLNNLNLACALYTELSQERHFPLKDLALIKSFIPCKQNVQLALEKINSLSFESQSIYEPEILLFKESKLAELPPALKVQTLWQIAHKNKKAKNRENFFLQALEIAKTIPGNPKLIFETKEKLYKNSPRLNPTPSQADQAAISADYRLHLEYNKSLKIDKQRLKNASSPSQKYLILKGLRSTSKTAQNKNLNLKFTTELHQLSRREFKTKRLPVNFFVEASVLAARTFWTEGQKDLARKILLEVTSLIQQQSSLDEIYFILGKISEESGDFSEALRFFTLSANQPQTTPLVKDRRLWSQGWVLYKQKNYEAAKKEFAKLSLEALEPGDRNRGLYWLARSTTSTAEKQKILSELQQGDPIGFYGAMAMRELKQEFLPLSLTDELEKISLIKESSVDVNLALKIEWLIKLRFDHLSVPLLDRLQKQFQKNNPHPSLWITLSSAYARAGHYLPLFALFTSLDSTTKNQLFNEHPTLLFPTPWLSEAQKAADSAGVPPELLLAITRQESAFNPHARSPADALGLMQLLPQVAKKIAQQHNISLLQNEDLFEPEKSYQLGALELKSLFDRWKKKWIPAVSSYNASEQSVKNWVQTRARPDVTEFIEEIPFEETRTYVRLVMRNQIFYKRLLTKKPFYFPEEYLTAYGN
jgi:soluble lytic murein transglycosylase